MEDRSLRSEQLSEEIAEVFPFRFFPNEKDAGGLGLFKTFFFCLLKEGVLIGVSEGLFMYFLF